MRRNFSSSGLTRLLGDLDDDSVSHAGESGQDFAEKLSLWVGVFDAGTLHAAHQAVAAGGVQVAHGSARTAPGKAISPREQLHQVRSILARTVAHAESPDPAGRRARLQFDPPGPVVEQEADFAPYRQHYQDQQRNMDLMIGPLRDNVRQILSAGSPALRQLAILDAVWEQMLAAREQKLLSAVPLRLKRRFESLRKAGRDSDVPKKPDQSPGQSLPVLDGTQPAWLKVFSRELQQVLLAELEVRLEPVTGLIEALEQEG